MDSPISMTLAAQAIPLPRLVLGLAPLLVVVGILWRWSLRPGEALYATLRMAVQLLLIGYVLLALFRADSAVLVGVALLVMLLAAGWIALRASPDHSPQHYGKAVAALAVGGGFTLLVVTQAVLTVAPWYQPRTVVVLGGMVFANGMNAVALAAERFASERAAGATYRTARTAAMRAAMIQPTNGLLAVGLVSIPGFMAGQMIDGASPLVAARYQLMIMAMVYGSAGLSAAGYLWQLRTQSGPAD